MPAAVARFDPTRFMFRGWFITLITTSMAFLLFAPTVSAQDFVSTDATVANGAGPVIEDDVAAAFHGANTLAIVTDLGLPPAAELSALHVIDATTLLFALKSGEQLGSVTAHAGDVLRWTEGVIALEASAAELGLGAAVAIDALTMNGESLVFSIDVGSEVNGTAASDSDLLSWSEGDGTVLWIPQDDCGIPHDTDVAALHLLADGDLLLGFANAAVVGGTAVRRGDIARCDPDTGQVGINRSFTELGPDWAAARIDAFSRIEVELIFKDSFESQIP